MIFLLDTNAVSAIMAADPKVDARLATLGPGDRVVTCTIVRGEILVGIQRLGPGRRRTALEANAAVAFRAGPCEPVPVDAADHHARIKLDCKAAGAVLDENDLWIAATAAALAATLVTRDKDFTRVSGLIIDDWTA